MVDDYRLAGDFEERWVKRKCEESTRTFDEFHGRRQQRKKQLITEVWWYPEMVLLWKAGLALPGDRFQHTPTHAHIHSKAYTCTHLCAIYTFTYNTHAYTHTYIDTHTFTYTLHTVLC